MHTLFWQCNNCFYLASTPEPALGPFSAILREKTGYTGPWVLGLGLTAVALSKEIYVVNAEVIKLYDKYFGQ